MAEVNTRNVYYILANRQREGSSVQNLAFSCLLEPHYSEIQLLIELHWFDTVTKRIAGIYQWNTISCK